MAWKLEETGRCPDCGTSRWEWDSRYGGHRQAYATETWLCPVCMQAEAVWDDIHKQKSKGKKVRLIPTRFHPTRPIG